jgi:hypothetical protein
MKCILVCLVEITFNFQLRIDNASLNSTLDTPGRFSLKSSERVLKDNHAFN